ncbi:MAG: acetyl-CoA carboxylase biotin carboxylase subunit [Paracoccaceae bacterium]
MFNKILVANRGEIACRIIKSAQGMGIKVVAVYSDADRYSPHTLMADEAIYIGESPAQSSYLDKKKIISAMKQTGAEAVHPGYGFLSENSDFAREVEENNFVFIGPPSSAIDSMGDKISSKKIAEEAGVSIVPGFLGEIFDEKQAAEIAKDIGFPVLIKASAGGGGKGMRVVSSDRELKQCLISSQNEAEKSFGDKRVFIEKYISNPRHIEIQVLADKFGDCIYLGERECSIQRRNQKVIEEAPSPFLDIQLRKKMGDQAVSLAKAVNYSSAGTVEFIVDEEKNFYFLEMNTRLQVEHPVTELVTGLDLVELMIKVACGEPLKVSQEEIELKGWALESRIYAEDPYRNFLPSTGRLIEFKPPLVSNSEDKVIRNDCGVIEGGEISIYYDPMISKLCSWGKTRKEAISFMQEALDDYQIEGIGQNIPFLHSVYRNQDFRSGNISTAFIENNYPEGFKGESLSNEERSQLVALVAFAYHTKNLRDQAISGRLDPFEEGAVGEYCIKFDDQWVVTKIQKYDDEQIVKVNDLQLNFLTSWKPGDTLIKASFNKKDVVARLRFQDQGITVEYRGSSNIAVVCNETEKELFKFIKEPEVIDTSKFLLCPMPGLLVSMSVKEGDIIEEGQILCSVEAMKMENVFKAEKKGKVKKVNVVAGDSLAVDDIIIEFE